MSLIIKHDTQILIAQWLDAVQDGDHLPVPLHERFVKIMSVLAEIHSCTRGSQSPKDLNKMFCLVGDIGRIRRNIALQSHEEHDIIIEMIDAIHVSIVFTENLAKPRKESGCVYFLLNETTNQVKIGWTTQIKERVSTLASQAGVELKLLGFFSSNSQRSESLMHKKFASSRKIGEWFEYDDELKDFICSKFGQ